MSPNRKNGGPKDPSRKEGQGLGSSQPFAGLKDLLVPFPELPPTEEGSLAVQDIEAKAKKVREKADEIKVWVRSALMFLAEAEDMSREAQELPETAKNIRERRDGLKKLMRSDDPQVLPAYRRATWMAYLDFHLNQEFKSRQDVVDVVAGLVEEGLLQESSDGLLEVFGTKYGVSDSSKFGDPETKEIAEKVQALVQKVGATEWQRRRDEAAELLQKSEMTQDEAYDGLKDGLFSQRIPPGKLYREKDGTIHRLAGGVTAWEFVREEGERRIYPYDCVGNIGFTRTFRDLVEKGYFLLHEKLAFDWLRLPKEWPPERIHAVWLEWAILQRGFWEYKRAKKATVSEEDFVSSGAVGIALVRYQGLWNVPSNAPVEGYSDGKIPFIASLLERKTAQDGTTTIQVLEFPEHLAEFIGHLGVWEDEERKKGRWQGKEYPEKENFEGCPYPLGSLLRGRRGQLAKAKSANGNGSAVAQEATAK